jgi:hypothetical protein
MLFPRIPITQDHGSLNHILKFPDVSRPVIALEELRRLLINPTNRFAGLNSISFDEIL